MKSLLFLFLASGFMQSIIALPLLMEKIPPNGLYGFRVKKTMENPDIWYPVNAYFGKWLLIISLVFIAAAVGFYYLKGIQITAYSNIMLVTWLLGFSIAMFMSIRLLKTL